HGRAAEPPGRPSRDRKYGHTHNSPGTGYDYSYPSVTQSPPNPQRAHSNLDEQRRQGDIHASGVRTSRGTEPDSRGVTHPRRARGLAGRRTGGHGEGRGGLAESEHLDQRDRRHRYQVRGAAGGQHGHPDADAERPPDEDTVTVTFTFLLVHLRLADRPGVGQHLEQDARLAVAVEPERE